MKKNYMKRANNINSTILINIVSTFILQGIAFLTTPIFTRLLGSAQYGIFSLFNSWVIITTCVMGLGIGNCLGTGLYTFKSEYTKFRNSVLLSSTIICLLEILIIFLLKDIIAQLIGFSAFLVMMIGITAFAHYVVNFAQSAFIYEKKALHNFTLSIFLSIFSVLLSVYFIYKSNSDCRYLGRIYGVAIPYIIVALVTWTLIFLSKPTKIQKKYLKYGFMVGFPVVFHSLSQQILGQSDRIMMQLFGIATAEIGIYSLFYTLSSILSTVLGALNNSWCPFYYDDVDAKKWDILNIKCKNYIELFTVICVGFLLLSREVSYIMADKNYWSGINIIPILTIAVYFTFMYQFPVNFEFFHKKTKIIAIGTVGSGTLNIILNIIMIPKWGMYGASIATALSYLALFFVHYKIVTSMKDHIYHLNLNVFIPGLIGICLGIVCFYILAPWWIIRWGLGIALGGLELYRIYKRKSIF